MAMLNRLLSHDLPRSRWLAAALLLILVGLAAAPFLFPGSKSLNVAAKILVFILLVASYDLLLGYTGIVSFAHTMFFGIGAYGVAIASTRLGEGWPALAVGYRYSAVATRMMRSSVLEVMKEDYIRTARAKGVYERLVVMRHALRNAMLPVITVVGLEFAFLIGGLVVTEQVFNLNGIGKLFVQSITRGDYTMIQALVMLVAVVFIVVNLIIDLLYARLDPRIRYR